MATEISHTKAKIYYMIPHIESKNIKYAKVDSGMEVTNGKDLREMRI